MQPATPRRRTMTDSRATLAGFAAISMWATLPPLASLAGSIPPFQLLAGSFSIAFLLALVIWTRQGVRPHQGLVMRPRHWLLGIYGIFGFHLCYFIAFQHAPALDALLIINLWPLLIVLFSSLADGIRLHPMQLLGAGLSVGGIVLLLLDKGDVGASLAYLPGYLAGFACAIIWSSYSLLSRRFAASIPRTAIGGWIGATALLSWLCHLLLETPQTLEVTQYAWLLLIGIFPTGLSFYSWDMGMRGGDVKLLGILAYAGPVIGAALLVLFGLSPFSPLLGLSAAMVLGGAWLGSRTAKTGKIRKLRLGSSHE